MSMDLDVVFAAKPNGLEKFLEEQDYTKDPDSSDDECTSYDHSNGWPVLYFFHDYKEEGKKVGYRNIRIESLLNINYPHDDGNAGLEAERLAQEIVSNFEAFGARIKD